MHLNILFCILRREITDDESDTDQIGDEDELIDDGEAVSEDEAEEPE